MGAKEIFYQNQAATIIKNLQSRKMEGYYCKNVKEAKEKLAELLGENPKNVGYGGSMTLDENGFKDVVLEGRHKLIVREDYGPEQQKQLKAELTNADTFLMSTNAITLSGKLVNIDGRGNRVSYLIYGPEEVIVIAGMNKVASHTEDALNRVRNIASPPNCVRLNKKTPCAITGKCGHCVNDTICSQIVITRTSMIPGRIKVILVGEELGY